MNGKVFSTYCAPCPEWSGQNDESNQAELVLIFLELQPCLLIREERQFPSPGAIALPPILGGPPRPSFAPVMSGTAMGIFLADFYFHLWTKKFSLLEKVPILDG